MTPEMIAKRLTGIPESAWLNWKFRELNMHSSIHQVSENEDNGKGYLEDGYDDVVQTYGEFLEEVKKLLVHFKLLP